MEASCHSRYQREEQIVRPKLDLGIYPKTVRTPSYANEQQSMRAKNVDYRRKISCRHKGYLPIINL